MKDNERKSFNRVIFVFQDTGHDGGMGQMDTCSGWKAVGRMGGCLWVETVSLSLVCCNGAGGKD